MHVLLVQIFRVGIYEKYFFLVEVSGNKLESSQTQVLSGFLPSFFLSTKCYSGIDSSFLVLRILLLVFLKAWLVFFKNPPVERL